MNKVLVKVYVLRLDEEYEVFLPPNKKVSDIICMLVRSLFELTNGMFPLNYQNLLFDRDEGEFFDPNKSLLDAGIDNGKKLILL